jgi:PilZ domain-containing protein
MSDRKPSPAASADWTHLLTDPDLISNLGKLLQIYREAPPEKREQALLDAMREIKSGNKTTVAARASAKEEMSAEAAVASAPAPTAPPFQPDRFTPSWGQDRRKYPRIKCYVAVELHVSGSPAPIWGNLANASMGGCFVESVTPVGAGADVDIGLWVSSGKIWVKGMVLHGVVTKSTPAFGIRVKFGEMGPAERESLRQFLKFVESTTKDYQEQNNYLAQLKR